MATPSRTFVTQEMTEQRDRWSEPRSAPPVSASDIRKWAIAVYWPETPPRIYWDEEYARTTRRGGIIAPQDFNPFAWPLERAQTQGAAELPGRGERPLATLNGGQVDTYGVPMRPGDVIASRSALVDWDEREGRLGLTLYVTNETRWENQLGERVKTRRQTIIRYQPE